MAKIINNLDFNKYQALNMKLQNVAGSITASATDNGIIYYNSTSNTFEGVVGGVIKPFAVGGSYVLPPATSSALGGIIVEATSGLTLAADGKLTVTNPYDSTASGKVASAIQGVKLNGTALTPDSNQIVDLGSVATLDGTGKIPAAQLPSYVDDVIEAANYSSLPASSAAEQGKIYIVLADETVSGKVYKANSQFRWSGSAWVELTSSMDIATKTEAEAGTEDTKMMTAAKVKDAILALSPIKKYTEDIGDGTATTITVTHNLGADVTYVLKEKASGEVVIADCVEAANTLTFTFAEAPAASSYTVVVIG